jgi:hypothetical protein
MNTPTKPVLRPLTLGLMVVSGLLIAASIYRARALSFAWATWRVAVEEAQGAPQRGTVEGTPVEAADGGG